MNVYEANADALMLAIAASCREETLVAAIVALARREVSEGQRIAGLGTFVRELTTHRSPRIREAALELIAKHGMHVIIEAAYDALLRQESCEIWSAAAYAITQCPDDLDRDGADTILRHKDVVCFLLRHIGYEAEYRRTPTVSMVIDRLQEAHDMLLMAGTGAKRKGAKT